MPTPIGPGLYNPYATSQAAAGSIPGDAATGHLKRQIGTFVDALEVQDTPVYTTLKSKAAQKTTNALKIENHIERVKPVNTTLAGGAYTAAGTSLNFGTTNIKYIQKGHVLLIESEYFWVNGDPNLTAGTAPVAFAQAGSSNANHAQNVAVSMIGTANPLNGPLAYLSPVIYGDFTWNTIQRFNGSIKLDEIAAKTPDWQEDGDKLLSWIEKESKIQKILLNKALMMGERQVGDPAVATETPPLLRGIRNWLTTNATTITGNDPLSPYHIEEVVSTIWSTYREQDYAILGSMKTKRGINRWNDMIRQTEEGETDLTIKTDTLTLQTGDYTFMVDPFMPDGELWGIQWNGFELYTFEGEDWATEDVTLESPFARQKSISATYSLMAPREPVMWRLSGFSTDLTDYIVRY
jgi:hypothetical protein